MSSELNEMRLAYPRVSDIIGKQTKEDFASIDIEALANAAIRGTKVHEYCASFVKGIWVPEIEAEYAPYVDEFKNWFTSSVEKVLFTNTRLYDDQSRFTGEFDMIVKLKGSEIALVDLKTSSNVSRSWPIQLAAYSHLCKLNGYSIDSVYNLHIKKTPQRMKCKLIPYEDTSSHWNIFSSALKCYKYFTLKEAT